MKKLTLIPEFRLYSTAEQEWLHTDWEQGQESVRFLMLLEILIDLLSKERGEA